ncbi:probable sarcosine oxidase [Cornus florida]|uniref:probable sarcosine oxidase n=1 Tax=Cornus florida TaxID=4283 RepID=UPI002899EF27|nr:probable sarcosine oxidase [Cornus florida]
MEDSGDQFDVIVVGAGIMGSSTAYQIAKRGHKVLLLEQFDFLHQRGSSHGESRTLRATYPEDYYSGMVKESSELWQQAESEAGYKVYFKTPHLDMGPSDNKSLRAVINSCRSNSVPCRILNPDQVHEEFSGRIKLPENWMGVVTELGGVIKPTKAVSMFQTLALRNGAVLRDNMEVNDIKRDEMRGGILVQTTNGERFWGKKGVVTAGAWIKKLVKRVSGLSLPVQPLETTVCYWRIKEEYWEHFTIAGGFPTFASYGEPYIYGTPSLEFPGLIKVPMHGGQPCDPDRRTWSLAPMMVDTLKEWIEARFGEFVQSSSGPLMTQSCLYSMTPDEDFVVDFLGGELAEKVVVAGGFSGHGFKMAPVVGRIVGDLVVSGEAKGVELKHFRLGRFDGNPKGNIKDFEDQVMFSGNSK